MRVKPSLYSMWVKPSSRYVLLVSALDPDSDTNLSVQIDYYFIIIIRYH